MLSVKESTDLLTKVILTLCNDFYINIGQMIFVDILEFKLYICQSTEVWNNDVYSDSHQNFDNV